MQGALGQESALTQPTPGVARPGRWVAGLRYIRRNVSLVVGILLLLGLALFVGIGHIILIVFLGLFFLTVGFDEIANPRLRRAG